MYEGVTKQRNQPRNIRMPAVYGYFCAVYGTCLFSGELILF